MNLSRSPRPSPAADDTAAPAPRLSFAAGGGRAPEPSPWRRWAPAMALLALVALFLLVFTAHRLVDSTPRLSLPEPRPFALMPFVNATGRAENRWVELALPEMLADALVETPGLEVVDPARVREALEPARDAPAEFGRPAALRELVASLGAAYVVEATVGLDGEEYSARLTAWEGEREVAEARLRRGDLTELAGAMLASIARGAVSGRDPVTFAEVYSDNTFLNRLYGVGLAELRGRGDAEQARSHFEICLGQQPRYVAARARLAESEARLGNIEASRQHYQTLLPEAQRAGLRHLLGRSLVELGMLAAASGRFGQAETLHAQARASFAELGNRGGEQLALDHLARLALTRGEPEGAEELFFDQLQLQQQLGDRLGQADTYLQLGSLALAGGEPEGAEELFVEAGKLAAELGDRLRQARALTSLGEFARRQGELRAAEEHWGRALEFYREQGEKRHELLLSRDLARVAAERGNLDLAERVYQDLIALAAEAEDPRTEAEASLELARVQLRGGYPYQARRHLDRAIELDRWLEDTLALQDLIARLAYEGGNYRLAVLTMEGIVRQKGEAAGAEELALLELYRRAEAEGRRLPLPDEL